MTAPALIRLDGLPAEARAAHADLSPHNLAFLEFAARRPECQARSTFRALERARDYGLKWRFQSWPTLVSGARVAEMERASVGLYRLLLDVPRRLFADDGERLARWYGLPRDEVDEALRGRDVNPSTMFGRGDFVRTAEGWKCVEFNSSSALGGWQYPILDPIYRGIPPIGEFLAEHDLRVRCRESLEILFSEILRDAREGLAIASGGEVHLAIASPIAATLVANMRQAVERAFRIGARRAGASAASGVVVCEPGDLLATPEGIYVGLRRRRVHALILPSDEWRLPPRLREVFEAGNLRVYNSPYQRVIRAKTNLAALSELGEESERLTAAERGLIRHHVPWTRRLRSGATRYRGHEVSLPELLLEHREAFVLKPAEGRGGEGVCVGREMADREWGEAVARAVGGGWIAQEHCSSRPYVYQWGESGCALQNLVWGLFTVGGSYAGGFVRMLPRDGPAVINSNQGAWEGPIFEIEDAGMEL